MISAWSAVYSYFDAICHLDAFISTPAVKNWSSGEGGGGKGAKFLLFWYIEVPRYTLKSEEGRFVVLSD